MFHHSDRLADKQLKDGNNNKILKQICTRPSDTALLSLMRTLIGLKIPRPHFINQMTKPKPIVFAVDACSSLPLSLVLFVIRTGYDWPFG